MAVIDKRVGKKGVSYRARVRVHGYPVQAKTFKRLTDAQTWAKRIETQIADGEFRNVSTQAKKQTLAEMASTPNLEERKRGNRRTPSCADPGTYCRHSRKNQCQEPVERHRQRHIGAIGQTP